MIGIFRTVILLLFAFLAGVFFERNQAAEACRADGGTPHRGLCRGLS